MIDNTVAIRNWNLNVPSATRVVNLIYEKFVGEIEYSISGPATDTTKGETVSQVTTAPTLKISFDGYDIATQVASEDIPFHLEVSSSAQEVMNAYGRLLVEANRKLDKLFQDTQETTDYINKYLKSHGQK
jgi:hypothetical protein